MRRLTEEFRNIGGFPNIIGAIDGSHIEITAPSENSVSYINRKGFHSLLVQGICDIDMKFIDVFTGLCGSVHDSRVWALSDIRTTEEANPGRFFPEDTHIIGDKAYGLKFYLMTPYKNRGNLTPIEVNYNFIHSRHRMVIERAFALLKGRFRRLKHLYLQNVEYGALIILACCVLHNICVNLNDEMNQEILDEVGVLQIEDNDDDNDDVNIPVNRRNVAADAAAHAKRNNIALMLMQ